MNRPQRGAALMLVLWLVVLMAALVSSFAFSARVESMLGRGLARSVAGTEAARAGIEFAVHQMWHADPAQRWRADGRTYAWTLGRAEIRLRLADVAGQVDVNASDAPLLAALMQQAQVPSARADALAAAVVGWRSAPFESVARLQQVPGMDAELYARLWPELTLYSGRALPDPDLASPMVLAALEVELEPLVVFLHQPSWGVAAGDSVDGDVFIIDAATCAYPAQITRAGEGNALVAHARGGWADQQDFDLPWIPAGLFDQFAPGGGFQRVIITLISD